MADKEILIFVEGPSDKVFLEVYLYFLEDIPIKNFKVKDVTGKDNLSKRLLEIEKYDKTLIIFDADKDYESNKKEILKVVSKTKQTISEEQIFLFPNNQDDGDLETLLSEIANYKEFINCFESYLDCIKKKEHYKPIKNIRKSMWYAYLEVLGLENLTKTDGKDKIKEKHKEEYEKLKEVIDFSLNSLIPLKNFLEKSTENKQKTKLKIF
ncbi:hypothetical protein DD749_05685 [Helicobacter pylori]|uniref:DUF3226 domain-containing protein n=1 Tax=Helicobacter pylori TaxID=210 RepID=UPI000EB066E8|nr:DUF3226 domain-containing protein [Helicobacter pylori]RKV17459.1 hypothetical protein DD749_05685 [Helicobacter pylori]